MILAGIKKELKLFTRGFRFWGILITIIGIAIAYPGLYKFIEIMANMLTQMAAESGMEEIIESANSMMTMLNSMAALYGGELAYVGFYTGVSSIATDGFLIMALLLMAAAGGEQKKRSVIMPNCAGLTPAGYIVPKFLMYPLLIGVLSFFGALLTALFSQLMFGGAIAAENMIFSATCIAVYMLFVTSIYFLFGIATGRPGVGVVVMYLGASLFPILLNALNINKYNPFALHDMIMTPAAEADMNNFWLSLAVTVILVVICCLLSLIITTVKKIDNSEGVANL